MDETLWHIEEWTKQVQDWALYPLGPETVQTVFNFTPTHSLLFLLSRLHHRDPVVKLCRDVMKLVYLVLVWE